MSESITRERPAAAPKAAVNLAALYELLFTHIQQTSCGTFKRWEPSPSPSPVKSPKPKHQSLGEKTITLGSSVASPRELV